jgi:hypothetical protein
LAFGTAGELGGFEPKQRMGEGENGGPTWRVEEEEGSLAASKTRGRRRRVVSGGRALGGVRTGKKRGRGEAADRWPGYCASSLNQIKPIQNNSNKFKFKSNLVKLHFIQT